MIAFEKIVAGMVLYDLHREKLGNTTMSELGAWPVKIIEVDYERRSALVRWNGNAPKRLYGRELTRLCLKLPKSYRDQEARKRDRGDYYDTDIDDPIYKENKKP